MKKRDLKEAFAQLQEELKQAYLAKQKKLDETKKVKKELQASLLKAKAK